MKIGIIGSAGVVGNACKEGLKLIGNEVIEHDLVLNSSIDDLLSTEIIYIAVPSPSKKDGSCDTSIVENLIEDLSKKEFSGIIAIKSTVEPGTTKRLINKHSKKICFVPEFLKERSAKEDFIKHGTLIIGSQDDDTIKAVIRSHGKLPEKTLSMDPTEAEMVKYFHNVFNAMRVVFANEIYEICKHESINYENVLLGTLERNDYSDSYLKVNKDLRGYAGVCLPKDTKALAAYCKKNNLSLKLFENIEQSNEKLKKTVFKNMRKS
tara:strand:+ start:1812 stop:2606 length:795 start_codon:yes stop_codon:yes gene_type:complete